jgi:hypothetical protein
MKKLIVNILTVTLFIAMIGPSIFQRSLFTGDRIRSINYRLPIQLEVEGPVWLKESNGTQKKKSGFSKWEPIILTVAVGGAVYLLYTVRSS